MEAGPKRSGETVLRGESMIRLPIDYRRRAWIILAFFLCLCIVSTACLSYFIIDEHLEYEVERTNMSLLREVDSKVTLVLRAIDKETIQLLQSKEVWEFMERDFPSSSEYSVFMIDKLSARLNGMLGASDHLQSIDLYSYAMRRSSSGNSKDAGGDLPAGYEWVRDFEKSGAFAYWMNTRPLKVGISGTNAIPVMTLVRSYPIIHPDGYRKGAVAVNVKEKYIYGLIKDAVASNSGSIYIMNAEGKVVSHSDKRMLASITENDPMLSKVPLDRLEGTLKVKADGADSTVFYYTSPYTGWKIVSAVPKLQLNKGVQQIRNALFAVCIVLILFASIVALAANLWTLRPVNRLVANISSSLQAHRLYAKKEGPNGGLEQIGASFSHIVEDSHRMFRQMTEHKPAVKWRLAMDLLTGIRSRTDPIFSLQSIGCRLHTASFVVIAMEFDRKSEVATPEEMHLYCYALTNVAEEMIHAETRGLAVEIEHGVTAAILSFEAAEESDMPRAYAVAERIKRYAEEHFKRTVTIGIGTFAGAAADIHRSYREATEALKYKMIIGGNSIISIEDVKERDSSEFYRLLTRTDGILSAVKAADRDKAEELARTWFAELSGRNATSDRVRQLAVQFMTRIMTMLDDMDIRMTQQEEKRLLDLLNEYDTVGQVEQCLIGLLDEAAARIEAKRNNREHQEVVDKMLVFIRDHYGRSDLSLNLLAEQFKQSVYHLSRIFKEQTGGNFIDYVMHLRMERAKELLLGSGYKVRDIAEEVGYTNLNSFVRIFKKSTGFTPTEFRELESRKAAKSAES